MQIKQSAELTAENLTMTSRPHVDLPRRRVDESETIRSREKLQVMNAVSTNTQLLSFSLFPVCVL